LGATIFININKFRNIKQAGVEYIPQDIQASDGTYDDKIFIQWSKVNDAEKYFIYRSEKESGSYNKIGMTEDNFFHDINTASEHGSYYYKIKSSLSSGMESDFSAPESGFRIKNEKEWQMAGNAGFSAGRADYLSLFVFNNTPYVSFRDSNYSEKASVMKFNGKSWEYIGNPGFSSGKAFFPALFVDKGTPYVAYTDENNSWKISVMKFIQTNL